MYRILWGLWLWLSGCSALAQTSSHPIIRAEYSMGTVFQIVLYADQPAAAEQAVARAFEIIREQDRLLSDWDPESELNQALKAAWPGPVAISPQLYEALEAALFYQQLTQGAFDISVGPLVKVWGFRPLSQPAQPWPLAWWQARQSTGSRHIRLLEQPPRLQLLAPGMQLDFGALGKGRALDLAGVYLQQQGYRQFALSCDSSMLFQQAPPDSPQGWPVVLRHPRNPEQVVARFWLQQAALASSGDDQQYRQLGPLRFSHLIDPRSGLPAHYSGSLTVVAPTASQADVLATALLIQPGLLQQVPESLGSQLTTVRLREHQGHWQCKMQGPEPPGWQLLPGFLQYKNSCR